MKLENGLLHRRTTPPTAGPLSVVPVHAQTEVLKIVDSSKTVPKQWHYHDRRYKNEKCKKFLPRSQLRKHLTKWGTVSVDKS